MGVETSVLVRERGKGSSERKGIYKLIIFSKTVDLL